VLAGGERQYDHCVLCPGAGTIPMSVESSGWYSRPKIQQELPFSFRVGAVGAGKGFDHGAIRLLTERYQYFCLSLSINIYLDMRSSAADCCKLLRLYAAAVADTAAAAATAGIGIGCGVGIGFGQPLNLGQASKFGAQCMVKCQLLHAAGLCHVDDNDVLHMLSSYNVLYKMMSIPACFSACLLHLSPVQVMCTMFKWCAPNLWF